MKHLSQNIEVKRANIELHNETAEFFEEKNLELFNTFEQRNLDRRLRTADKTCSKRKFCCDLACGTGNLIARQIPEFEQVIGLDISRGMISICKSKGLGKKANFLIGDVEKLPFQEGTFDIVTMHAALHHVPSRPRSFRQIYRVLSKKGIMYIDHEPNSRRFRRGLEKPKRVLDFIAGLRIRKSKTRATRSNAQVLFPSKYRIADIHQEEGFYSLEARRELEAIGFSAIKITYHNVFSMYFFRLPTPLNMLSVMDNILERVPVVRNLSSHVCIWAKK
ncbi:MAG: class I SAM-dependent methyltransferase [Candidatus Bathyarchaeia archaeon]